MRNGLVVGDDIRDHILSLDSRDLLYIAELAIQLVQVDDVDRRQATAEMILEIMVPKVYFNT